MRKQLVWPALMAAVCTYVLLLLVFIMVFSQRPAELKILRSPPARPIAGIYSLRQAAADAATRYAPDPSEGGCCPLWRTANTEAVEVIAGSSRMRMERHTVRAPDGKLIRDWLWADERDAVNVMVRRADGRFVVFRQTKYGLDGHPSLALIGGYIEDGETAMEAARREVGEELRFACPQWLPLGRYRTAVNRGGGWVSAFLATACAVDEDGAGAAAGPWRPSDDLEAQKPLLLEREELRQAVLHGQFREIKWQGVAALALLHTA